MKQISTDEAHPGRNSRKVITVLSAMLVVGVLISGSLLLFSHLSLQASSGSGSSSVGGSQGVGKTITVVSSAGGLEMSMKLTAGPYFLSEMVAADIALTNHTNATNYVGLPFSQDACGYWSGIIVTGGNKPDYTIPIATDHSCPAMTGTTPVKPGQTLTVHKYLPLTNSGKQTLTAQTAFYSAPDGYPKPISSPFEKHWPALQIDVSPTIPSDRKLSFNKEGSQIVVSMPVGTPSHLVYLYGVGCVDSNNDGGSTISGNYGWEPISINKVSMPGCPGKNIRWDFAFGMPGYGIAIGKYPSS